MKSSVHVLMSDEKSVTTSLKLSGVSLTISCVALTVENCSLQFQSRTKACKMKNNRNANV